MGNGASWGGYFFVLATPSGISTVPKFPGIKLEREMFRIHALFCALEINVRSRPGLISLWKITVWEPHNKKSKVAGIVSSLAPAVYGTTLVEVKVIK